jgi:AAA family ATP:ADP antiporter
MMMTNLAVGVLCFTGLQQAGLFFGSMQNSLTRAAKYTVFDATKEMVYIPLSPEEQRKGKATIDGIGSRFGKSGGSILYQALLMVCSSLTATGPYVAGLVVVFVALWIVAIFGLHKEMQRRMGCSKNGLGSG